MTRHRRSAAVLALFLGLSPAVGLAQTPAPTATQVSVDTVQLTGPEGRTIDVAVFPAADERAVVVFSHGLGAEPRAYQRLIASWTEAGFTIVAPLHVDSQFHPRRAEFDGRAAFGARLADLASTRGFVKQAYAGKPMVAAGHSYGTLMSLIAAGAVTPAGSMADPAVKAVIGLSTPGEIPGLVTPDTYAAVSVPTLIVTGDADLVPGYVTDWHAHRAAFDRSAAGGKMLLIYEGGDHSLVRDADAEDFDLLARATTDFIAAHALDDAEAQARLTALTAPTGVAIERR